MENVYCVVMAGGIGSRFWPMSREKSPKQFLDILGTGSSLIQLTYERFSSFVPDSNFMVVTSDDYVSLTKSHIPAMNPELILAEPGRKNTAPCIAYAAYKLYKENPDAIMIISPADHVILKQKAFETTMQTAISHASETDHLVTIGIKPSRPDTGYGYIQFHQASKYTRDDVKQVKTFTEKPQVDLALQFLQSGDFYWNSGMFIWKVSAIVKAFEQHMPDLASAFNSKLASLNTEQEEEAIKDIYGSCESISIDYGIMEKAENVDLVLSDFGWSDLGTWGSLYEQLSTEAGSNVVINGEVKTYSTNHSIIRMPKDKLAVVQGLTNYIVVDTDDVLLICQKDEEQKIKQIVADLREAGKTNVL